MTIQGLTASYFFAKNDIWIKVLFETPTEYLELTATNLATNAVIKLRATPNNGECHLLISPVALALLGGSIIGQIELRFEAKLEGAGSELQVIPRNFIAGRKYKTPVGSVNDNWTAANGDFLVVGPWGLWEGVALPSYPQKLEAGEIVEQFIGYTDTFPMKIPSLCNPIVIRFRNSLGGLQFYVFENWQIERRTRAGDAVDVISQSLAAPSFRNADLTETDSLTVFTKTPGKMQEVFADLVRANEVWVYDQNGLTTDDKFRLLKVTGSSAVLNSWFRVYENQITFEL